MAYSKQNTAIATAVSQSETQTSPQATRQEEIVMQRMNDTVKSPGAIVLLVLVTIVLILAVVMSYMQDFEASKELKTIKSEYSDLQTDILDMKSEIAGKTSSKIIQEYAENVLGMSAIDSSQIEYLEIQTDDVVSIPDEEENVFARIQTWFANMVDYLRG